MVSSGCLEFWNLSLSDREFMTHKKEIQASKDNWAVEKLNFENTAVCRFYTVNFVSCVWVGGKLLLIGGRVVTTCELEMAKDAKVQVYTFSISIAFTVGQKMVQHIFSELSKQVIPVI